MSPCLPFVSKKSYQNRHGDLVPYPLEPIAVDKASAASRNIITAVLGCAACVNACPSNALTVETVLRPVMSWRGNSILAAASSAAAADLLEAAAIKLLRYGGGTGGVCGEDFLQQNTLCAGNCRVCNRPFMIRRD